LGFVGLGVGAVGEEVGCCVGLQCPLGFVGLNVGGREGGGECPLFTFVGFVVADVDKLRVSNACSDANRPMTETRKMIAFIVKLSQRFPQSTEICGFFSVRRQEIFWLYWVSM
jgi:hypothetical protein